MRLSLGTKITLALVLFGVVPASVITYFAYESADDFKARQGVMIREAAGAANDRIVSYLAQKQGKYPVKWPEAMPATEKQRISELLNSVARDFSLPTADIMVVDASKV